MRLSWLIDWLKRSSWRIRWAFLQSSCKKSVVVVTTRHCSFRVWTDFVMSPYWVLNLIELLVDASSKERNVALIYRDVDRVTYPPPRTLQQHVRSEEMMEIRSLRSLLSLAREIPEQNLTFCNMFAIRARVSRVNRRRWGDTAWSGTQSSLHLCRCCDEYIRRPRWGGVMKRTLNILQ
jgi:hypothetical protein